LVRLEAGAGSLTGFESAVEDEGGIGSFFGGRLKEALNLKTEVRGGKKASFCPKRL
jgi:hypothetical protein